MESQMYRDLARLEDEHWWCVGRREVVLAVLRHRLPSLTSAGSATRRILDVGCGTGAMLSMLTEFGEVEGVDSSEEGLAYCRERVGPHIQLHRGALPDDIPTGKKYELITAFDVLEHIADDVAAMRAIHAALLPSGMFVCTVPAFPLLWSSHDQMNHHKRRYTRKSLNEQLRNAGFEVSFCSFFNATLFPPIAAVRLAQKVFPVNGPVQHSDLSETPPMLNRLLGHVFAAERLIVPRVSLPFGVSLLAIATAD